MKSTSVFFLLLSLILTLSACDLNRLIDPIDYPPSDRSQLKGPQQKNLPVQPFTLTPSTAFPFSGQLVRYGSRNVLRGYNGTNKVAILESGTVIELTAQSPQTIFTNQTGTIWGLTQTDKQITISQFNNNKWTEPTVIAENSAYYSISQVDANDLYLYTSTGTLIWNLQQKAVKETISTEKARIVTQNFLIGSDNESFTIYNKQTRALIASWPFNDYVATKRGISNTVWGAFEDAQNNVWLVLEDSDWDGILFKYDGTSLQKLSLIPVGYYDSGRSVSDLLLDSNQNLWLTIDGVTYLYDNAGKWLLPSFDLIKSNYGLHVSVNEQGKLLANDNQRFYLVNQ